MSVAVDTDNDAELKKHFDQKFSTGGEDEEGPTVDACYCYMTSPVCTIKCL